MTKNSISAIELFKKERIFAKNHRIILIFNFIIGKHTVDILLNLHNHGKNEKIFITRE